MQLSQDQKGEFYTSGVIKAMLDDKIPCKMLQLERTDLHVLGTPAQVRSLGLTPSCFSLRPIRLLLRSIRKHQQPY